MVETYASTPDELTIRQPDGPGFFHVSLGEDGVTLGCSTTGEALPCFYAVRDAAVTDKRLLDNLAGDAHLTVHLRSSANEEPIRELPAGRHGIGSWLEGVFSDMPEFVAARLDVGDWSWQWDNLGTPEWEMWDDGWTVVTADRRPSAQFEHTLLVTADGAEVLTLP